MKNVVENINKLQKEVMRILLFMVNLFLECANMTTAFAGHMRYFARDSTDVKSPMSKVIEEVCGMTDLLTNFHEEYARSLTTLADAFENVNEQVRKTLKPDSVTDLVRNDMQKAEIDIGEDRTSVWLVFLA